MMKHISRVVVGIVFMAMQLAISTAQTVAADEVVGRWSGTWEAQYGRAGSQTPGDVVFEITSVKDGNVAGMLHIKESRAQYPVTDKMSGDVVTFSYVSSRATQHDFALKLSGDKLAGPLELSGIGISPGVGGFASFTRQR